MYTEEQSSQSSEAAGVGELVPLAEEDIEQYVCSPGHYMPNPSTEAAPFEYSGEKLCKLGILVLKGPQWLGT